MTIVFLKILPKNTQIRLFGKKECPIKAFLDPNLAIFIISQYFAIRKIQGC